MQRPFSDWEIILYEVQTVIPYLVLTVLVFRGKFRMNRRRNLAFMAFLVFLQVLLALGTIRVDSKFYPLSDLAGGAIYLVFLFALIEEKKSKLLFYLIALSNFSNFTVIMGKYLEGRFFMTMALERYRYTFSIMQFLVELVVLPLLYLLVFRDLAEIEAPMARRWKDDPGMYLWLVPETFFLVWMVMFYGNDTPAYQRAVHVEYAMSKLLIDLGSVVIYREIFRLIRSQKENRELQARIHAQELQLVQAEAFDKRLTAIRLLRHDLRKHTGVLQGLLEAGDSEGALEYLKKAELVIDPRPLTYCDNLVANLVVQYYADQAARDGVDLKVELTMGKEIFLEPNDVTVLLGNLLSNAVEAAAGRPEGKRSVLVRGRPKTESVYTLLIRNTYEKEPGLDRSGRFLSRHHEGRGLGLESARQVALKYGGTLDISYADHIFQAAAVLYRKEKNIEGTDE